MRIKVRWTKTELALLTAAVEKQTRANPGSSLKSIVARAQEAALPPERHRRSQHPSNLGRATVRAIKEAYQRGLIVAPLVRPEPELEREAEPPKGEEIQPVEPPVSLHSFGTEQILAELLMRIGSSVIDRIEARFDRLESAIVGAIGMKLGTSANYQQRHIPSSPRIESKPKPPVVTVVGLLKDQFEHVKRKVAELGFELVFADKDQAKPSFGRTDYVVVQRHSPHTWFDAAQKIVSNDRLAFADGGVSNTVQRICDFHARRIAEAAKL